MLKPDAEAGTSSRNLKPEPQAETSSRNLKPKPQAETSSRTLTLSCRHIARACEAQSLPLATPPPNSERILPAMALKRLCVANQLALVARAPADARGYRVGIQHGSMQLVR